MAKQVEPEKTLIQTIIGWIDAQVLAGIWVVTLSMMGGVVSYIGKVRRGEIGRFSFTELIGELITSGFIGIVTLYVAKYAGFSMEMTAVCCAITGHMGTRAIMALENALERKFNEWLKK